MKSTLKQGELINWKDEKGFGFIRSIQSKQDVFVHISSLRDSTRRPRKGDTIVR